MILYCNEQKRSRKSSQQYNNMTAPKLTKYKKADLLKIHTDKATQNYHWISLIAAKAIYSQNRSAILNVCHTYGVPMRQLSNHGQLLMSQPAFDHVLTHTPELESNSEGDTAMAKLERITSEAEAEARAEIKAEFKAKLEAATNL